MLLWKLPALPAASIATTFCSHTQAQQQQQQQEPSSAWAALAVRLEQLHEQIAQLEQQASDGPTTSSSSSGHGGMPATAQWPAPGQFRCSTGTGAAAMGCFTCEVAPLYQLLGHEGSVHRWAARQQGRRPAQPWCGHLCCAEVLLAASAGL